MDLRELVTRLEPLVYRAKTDCCRARVGAGEESEWVVAVNVWLSEPSFRDTYGASVTAPTVAEAEAAAVMKLYGEIRSQILHAQQDLGRRTADLANVLMRLEPTAS